MLEESPDDSAATSMWLVNYVLIVGTLTQATLASPFAGPVPLPLPRPKTVAKEPVEIETITQPRTPPNQRKTNVRRDL